jgi:hypothetical protein
MTLVVLGSAATWPLLDAAAQAGVTLVDPDGLSWWATLQARASIKPDTR